MNHDALNVTERNFGTSTTDPSSFAHCADNRSGYGSSQIGTVNGAGRNRSVTSVIHDDRGDSSVTTSSFSLVPNAPNSSPNPRGAYRGPQTHFQDVSLLRFLLGSSEGYWLLSLCSRSRSFRFIKS